MRDDDETRLKTMSRQEKCIHTEWLRDMVIFQGVMVVNQSLTRKRQQWFCLGKKWTGGQKWTKSGVQNSGKLLKETFTTAWVYLVWWTDVQL